MTKMIQTILLSALEMKLASIKRARKSNNSPTFAAAYDLEEETTNNATAWVRAQKTTDNK